jgi:hypothetical protein
MLYSLSKRINYHNPKHIAEKKHKSHPIVIFGLYIIAETELYCDKNICFGAISSIDDGFYVSIELGQNR